MRDELIEASNDVGGDIPINDGPSFASKTEKYVTMLREIDVATKASLARVHTPAAFRDDLDTLIESIEQEKSDPTSQIFNCKLGEQYSGPNASIELNSSFDNGVLKIHIGSAHDLLQHEQRGSRV